MKIAVIHSIYKPYTRGGAEVVVDSIVSGLKERGEDVFVVTLGKKNDIIARERSDRGDLSQISGGLPRRLEAPRNDNINDNIKVYRIKPFNLFNFLDINKKPAWLRAPWHIIDMVNDVQTLRIWKVLRDEKPDLVLTHNLKGLGYYIPWLLKIMGVRHIHTVHDAQLIHPSGLYKREDKLNLFVRFYAWLCKKLFGLLDKVVFPSLYMKSVYEEFGFFKNSEKIVLGNPTSLSSSSLLFPRKRESQEIPDQVGDDNEVAMLDTFNILFVGQVEEYKGIVELIKAAKEIQGNLILHVVGDGSVLDQAKELAGGNEIIKFYGRLDFNEAVEKINPDILINPSKTPESFGMVVIQAFSFGVPVIASNIGALPELVEESVTGWLVEAGNVEDLKQKISWCMENRDKVVQLRDNCLKTAGKYNTSDYLNKLLIDANIQINTNHTN